MENTGKTGDLTTVHEQNEAPIEEDRFQRFRRLNDVKTWSFQAYRSERDELDVMVRRTGLSRKEAVLAALRKYLERDAENEI